jgi:hypothetical protein
MRLYVASPLALPALALLVGLLILTLRLGKIEVTRVGWESESNAPSGDSSPNSTPRRLILRYAQDDMGWVGRFPRQSPTADYWLLTTDY